MATHVQPSTQQPTPTSTSLPPPPKEFHLFSSLPLEIRLRIYTLSLPSRRLIPLIHTPPTILPRQSPQHQHQNQRHHQHQQPTSTPQPYTHNTTSPHIHIHPQIHTPIHPPSLLHTAHESRVYIQTLYTPCLPLSGHTSPSLTTLSPNHPYPQPQPLYRPTHDILHLPSLSGYNAPFKNFTSIHTLADATALRNVRRLAVSGNVFLEEEKKRWRRVAFAGGAAGGSREVEVGDSRDRYEKDARGDAVLGAGRGEGGIDGVTVRNLEGLWDVVRRKFAGLEEAWILGGEMEGRVLDEEIDGGEGRLDRVSDGSGFRGMTRKRRMSFKEKVERAVRILEDETGWTTPS